MLKTKNPMVSSEVFVERGHSRSRGSPPAESPDARFRVYPSVLTMVASRPTVMAPPRSTVPARVCIAHMNAKNALAKRLREVSASVLLRSKTAQAHRSLTATQEIRDTWSTIDVDGTWGTYRNERDCLPIH